MRNTLLLIFIFGAFITDAQIKRVAITAAANYSSIPDVTNTYSMQTTIPTSTGYGTMLSIGSFKQQYDEKPGFDLSGRADYTLSRRFFVSSGLGVSYSRFKRSGSILSLEDFATQNGVTGSTVYNGVPVGSFYGVRPILNNPVFSPSENLGKTSIVYIQVPVMAGVSLLRDKLLVRGGATFSGLVYASEYKQRYDATDGSFHDYKDTDKDGFNSILAGLTLNVSYYIVPSLGIDLTANKFLSSIYNIDDESDKAKMTLLSLGVSYSIVK